MGVIYLNGVAYGGGGGGTSDYNQLYNLPTINDNPIKGEISDDILELIEPLTTDEENNLLDIITEDPNE